MAPRNHYRLFVADIDGTLLDGKGAVSADDIAALAALRRAGIGVSLSSGRARNACLGVIDNLALDGYHIFFDGALVATPDLRHEVYARPLGAALLRRMLECARDLDLNLELYTAQDYFIERENWSTQAHRDFFGIEPTLVDFAGIEARARIIKALLAITNPDEAARVQAFRERLGDSLHFSEARTPAYPTVTFINIVMPQTSKGKALEALVSHLRLSMDEVVAVGDGSNDVSLLSTAGLAIAMGNALSEVKAVADYVTLDVEHSGVAAAVKKFLL